MTEIAFKPLIIDFSAGKTQHRRKQGGSELLLRALGKKNKRGDKETLSIIDATAGLGRDAFVFACAGYNVLLFERSPTIAALLGDALQRAAEQPELTEIMKRMRLITGDANHLLALHSADIIYLDPMFPERKKTALVKKEMRILQELVGDDADSEQLLISALACARKRVIVKRPLHAPSLSQKEPDIYYKGKTSRFDVYLTKIG